MFCSNQPKYFLFTKRSDDSSATYTVIDVCGRYDVYLDNEVKRYILLFFAK